MSDMTAAFENKDDRPQKGGFAPGNYTCKCHVCDNCFMGDKRASQCAPCAYLDDYILRKDVESLAKSFALLVDCKLGCDGVLLASTRRYNEIVKLFNEILKSPGLERGLINPSPSPRYDETFVKGVESLD